MARGGIGERVRAYRRRRGLSQAALAGLVGRSKSWLSQVERGVRSVDRLSVVAEMARVLNVDVQDLTGRPWQYGPNGGVDVESLSEVRRTFTRYEHLRGTSAPASVSLDTLRRAVHNGHADYQAARHSRVVEQLPSLVVEAERIRCQGLNSAEDERDSAFVYVLAAKLVTKFGVSDLSMLAADRAVNVASSSESLMASGLAGYQVACALLRSDQAEDAEDLTLRLADRLTIAARPDAPSLVSAAGALWLIAAIVAARRTQRAEAWAKLDQADRLAGMLGEDANHGWTAFGPTNVAIHRVSVAVELGDAGEAIRLAADVDPQRLPVGLTSRRAQLSLDLAWAQTQRRRDAEATLHLLEAERVGPETVRHNVIAQELIRELLSRNAKSKTSALSDLAVRAGILH